MTDRSGRFAERLAGSPQLIEDAPPVADNEASPDGNEAVRRIRSFSLADIVFRSHTGAAHAFPSYALRTWLSDGRGQRLTLIWPEGEVSLRGRSPRGERLRSPVPHGHWKTITLVAGLHLSGMAEPFVLDRTHHFIVSLALSSYWRSAAWWSAAETRERAIAALKREMDKNGKEGA